MSGTPDLSVRSADPRVTHRAVVVLVVVTLLLADRRRRFRNPQHRRTRKQGGDRLCVGVDHPGQLGLAGMSVLGDRRGSRR